MRPRDIFGKGIKDENIPKGRYNQLKDKHCVVVYWKLKRKGTTAIIEHQDGIYSVMIFRGGAFTWTMETGIEAMKEIIKSIEMEKRTVRKWEDQEKIRRFNEKLLLYSI